MGFEKKSGDEITETGHSGQPQMIKTENIEGEETSKIPEAIKVN